jgi:small subunit ribosomal protein S2
VLSETKTPDPETPATDAAEVPAADAAEATAVETTEAAPVEAAEPAAAETAEPAAAETAEAPAADTTEAPGPEAAPAPAAEEAAPAAPAAAVEAPATPPAEPAAPVPAAAPEPPPAAPEPPRGPVTIKELLEAGVHFGHQTRRWNPKMKGYIFGERNGIYIIDLQKTQRMFQDALQFAEDLGAQGQTVLFIGTKRQAQEAVAEEAQRCGMPYVTERWLGGLLTNFATVRKSLERMRELETTLNSALGTQRERLTKKELGRLDKERQKLAKNLTGIKSMKAVPDAVFVIDTRREAIAVAEARKLRIPVIGILDTNSDPDEVDVPIPGNDDALRAIRLFAGRMADSILAGRGLREAHLAEAAGVTPAPPRTPNAAHAGAPATA